MAVKPELLYHACLFAHSLIKGGVSLFFGLIMIFIDPLPAEWSVSNYIYSAKFEIPVGVIFICEETKEIIVAFRGTSGLRQWMYNFGFCGGYNKITEDVIIPPLPEGYTVHVTGSSLGGVFAKKLSEIGGPLHADSVTTFGSPECGVKRIKAPNRHYQVRTDPVCNYSRIFHEPDSNIEIVRLGAVTWWQYVPWGGHLAPGYWYSVSKNLYNPFHILIAGFELNTKYLFPSP